MGTSTVLETVSKHPVLSCTSAKDESHPVSHDKASCALISVVMVMDESLSDGAAKRTQSVPGSHRPRATVACIVCKTRKIRCTGIAPCDTCRTLHTRCIIDETLDGRRKVALSRRLEEFIHHKWIFEGFRICLRFARGSSMTNVLEQVMVDAPLPFLTVSILTSLSGTVVPEEIEKHVDQIKQHLEHYVCEADHKAVTSWIPRWEASGIISSRGRGPASILAEGSSFALESKKPAYAPDLPQDGGMSGALYWPPSQSYDMALSPDTESDRGLEHILQWLRGVSGHTKLEESADLSFGFSAMPGHRLGEKSLSPLSSNLRPARSSIPMAESLLRSDDHDKRSAKLRGKKRPLSTIVIPATFGPPTAGLSKQSSPNHVSSEETKTSRSSSLTSAHIPSSFAAQCSPEIDPGSHPAFPSVAWPRRIAPHVSLPKMELDGDPMARAIISYLDLARSMLSQGTPIQEVFGPQQPIVDLLFRSRKETDAHSICHFACGLTSGLDGMDPAAKLGLTFMFIHLIRWLILCSSSNYAQIPELYRPTAVQINIPHSAAIEFCPFPQLRDVLCQQYRDFLPALASNISCNWPYSVDTCVQRDEHTGHIVLTDTFCRHILGSGNWTVKSDIFDVFPECKGLIKTAL